MKSTAFDIKGALSMVANRPAPILELVKRGAAEGCDLERALREARGKLQAGLAVIEECLRWMASSQEPAQSVPDDPALDTVERFMKWAVVNAPDACELRAEPLYQLYSSLWFDRAAPGWFDKIRSGEVMQGSAAALAMGKEPFNGTAFGRRLRALGYRKYRHVYVRYVGLRLSDEASALGGYLFEGL